MILKEYNADEGTSSSSYHREYTVTCDDCKANVSWRPVKESRDVDTSTATQESSTNSDVLSSSSAVKYSVKRALSDLFLPIGYPNSVREGYLEYQFYDSLQGLCSYLRGVVSTSAVLTAAGVGDAEATAMSAAVQWAAKDGLGMLGGLLFSYYSSSKFDSYVKEFRLFADVINDVGLTLDMMTPHVVNRSHVFYISSLATLCRVMCGISAGATKGSITQHFAIHNMADLNAKEGSQETLVSLVGMILGIALATYLQGLEEGTASESNLMNRSVATTWVVFGILTFIHVWANYVGVEKLRLRTMNRERTKCIMAKVIDRGVEAVNDLVLHPSTTVIIDCKENWILSPNACSESLVRSMHNLVFNNGMVLGASLCESLHGIPQEELNFIFGETFREEQYLLSRSASSTFVPQKLCVSLRSGASQQDILKSFLHANILIKLNLGYSDSSETRDWKCLVERSKDVVDFIFDNEIVSLQKLQDLGWHTDKLYLNYDRWRIDDTIKDKAL